ncbi:hypothetical protein G7K71_12300 [Desulfofundulus sp. TPOSR]|nr:ATP-binding protein [Desulfofundulus sp. TPOSR]NHM27745.1 hypothetical protein [Desulfofundulus sp. TPOSR]
MFSFLKKPSSLLVFTVSLYILVIAGLTTWLQVEMNQLADNYYAVGKESYRLLFEVEKVKTLLLEMETGERGYLLTGEKRFLKPYNSGKAEIEKHFSALVASLEPESPPWHICREIQSSVRNWVEQVVEPNIALRQKLDSSRLNPAEFEIIRREEKGGEMMDGLLSKISRLEEDLLNAQEQRLARIYALHRRLVREIYLSTGASVLAIFTLGVMLFRRLQVIEENNVKLTEQEEHLRFMVSELEAASRLKSEFLASMSHELRTPLNAIIGFAQVLQKQYYGPLTEKQSTYVEYILTSGQHLLSLINDILDLSKIEAGKMELDLSPVSIHEVIQNSLLMVRERAKRHGITLSWQVAEDVPQVTADERKMKQIIYNLLTNAVKFTPEGGSVRVTARLAADGGEKAAGSYVEISVTDTGIGIPLSEQERIFEPFVQLESGHARQYEGTGLGLALVRRLVELHGGRIRVYSEGEGKGSTFSFTLPVERQDGGDAQ